MFSEGTMISTFLASLLVIMFVYFHVRINNLQKRYAMMMMDKDGESLESLMLARLEDIQKAKSDIVLLHSRCSNLKEQLEKCVQKVGVVRFNAFEDTGSDLSFAVALLDEKSDGVVISSIYGRSEARCYAKPITSGDSEYALSDEEKLAIKKK